MPMEPNPIAPATILVVDDQEIHVDLVTRWLEAEGHTIVGAHNGESALTAVAEHQPDLILLDIMIPAPSGFEVCRQITCDPATRHIPVLLMSGLQDPANWKRGLDVGAVELLRKPLKPAEVRAKVRLHLERSRAKK
jgi:putative two-component system response regulator